ncbi:hypothetical protein AAFF_G00306100 [Aldrovandia affinis]|uniref:Kinocilin n=1 Tax=Aldrovandia affinis TaxID=143900 RepID=A0AAD7WS62_9TELE|nr:hypothetical protein AAFF_G00306100 [Aldrovandia affinis]
MSTVSIGEYQSLRVGSAALGIVAGCIIIGVSRECGGDAVGGIFLGAGGLGLLISVYPIIRAWLNFNHLRPAAAGMLRIHPMPPNVGAELPADTLKREATQSQLNLERSKSKVATLKDLPTAEPSPEEGPSDVPDIIGR